MIERMADTTSTTSKSAAKPAAPSTPVPTEPASTSGVTYRDPGYVKPSVGTPVLLEDIPMTDDGAVRPTPGDPRTEPVATAEQSWVPGRVGPATIPQDATAATIAAGADGVDEVAPGTVLADTSEGLGRVPESEVNDPIGENLARIVEDQDAGRPLDEHGRRVDAETGQPLTGKAAVSR